ncbi:MAG: hypothetical protein ACYDEO_07930 [Aggregatilineales bacterium]
MSELALQVPDSLLARLQNEAKRQHVSLDDLMLEVIDDYLADSQDDEPTKAEILEGLREGMRDALAGRTHSAREILDEVRRELEADANDS